MSTIAQKLVSGSLLRTIALVANGFVAFMLFPFLVHHLGDRQYGFWALVGTFVGYYGMLDFGLTGTVGQYISGAIGRRDDQECNAIFNAALRIHSLLGVAALAVTLAVASFSPLFFRSSQDASLFWKVMLLVGLTVAMTFPLNTYQGLLLAGLRFDVISWLALLTLALRTTLIILAVLAGRGLIGIAWAGLLATLPSCFLTFWITQRQFPWIRILAGSAERKTTKSLFSYSAYLFITDIADRLRFQVDPVVITAFIGLAAVTHYRIAGVFADQYMRIMISVVGVFWPLLSQLHGAGEGARIKKTFFFATKISLCMASFLCFGLITWGRPMIERWMGPPYLDSYWPLVVLTVAMLLDLCQMPTVSLLYATFKHRVYAFLNLAEGVLNLGVSLILVRQYKILGVALGTLVAAIIIRIIIQPWWMCKVSDIPYGTYVRFLSRTILRCAVLIAACFPLTYWGLKPDYKYLFSSAVCATILYALGSWVAVFDKNEREMFRAVLRRRDKQRGLAPVVEVSPGTSRLDAREAASLGMHKGA